MLPIAFVVGTARSGRQFLRHNLVWRPNMFTGLVQEPSFSAFASGASCYARSIIQAAGARLLRKRHAFSIIDAPATRRLFRRAQGRLERGNCAPARVSPAAAVQSRGMVPDTSLVAMLLMLIMTTALLAYARQTGRPGLVYR